MTEIRRCEACGKPAALVNYDKLRGRVGMTRAWVHVSRFGRLKLHARHAPVVREATV